MNVQTNFADNEATKCNEDLHFSWWSEKRMIDEVGNKCRESPIIWTILKYLIQFILVWIIG